MGTKSTALAVAAGILCSGAALASWDFDHRLAETYAGLFAPAMEGQTGKALHCIQPKALLRPPTPKSRPSTATGKQASPPRGRLALSLAEPRPTAGMRTGVNPP